MNYTNTLSHVRLCAAAAAVLVLTGCATTANNPQDPLEGYNRAVYSFNDAVDRTVLKPTATAYKKVVPGFAQTGVNNFFGNLSDAWSSINNFLQGKGEAGATDFGAKLAYVDSLSESASTQTRSATLKRRMAVDRAGPSLQLTRCPGSGGQANRQRHLLGLARHILRSMIWPILGNPSSGIEANRSVRLG